jgi:FkbM family methyltransferase
MGMEKIPSFGGKTRINGWMMLSREKSMSFRNMVQGKGNYDHNFCLKLNKFFARNATKRRVAIDVGASYGFVSEYLAGAFHKVKSFEIVPQIRECLIENVSYRALAAVEVFPYGLGEEEGEIDVYFNPIYTGHSSHYKNIDIQNDEPLQCEVRTLDSFEFDEVDFIKIDVEGFELQVLRGALETIKRHRPVITTEHSMQTPSAVKNSFGVVELMESLDYEYIRTIGGDFIWSPKEYNHIV